MRHPHGLRAAAGNQGIVLPNIGDAFKGGYYAGLISHTANGVATHALIVAPRATGGATGTGYTLTTMKQIKTANTETTGTTSVFDGKLNTDAIVAAGIADHPAAQFCVNLTIGGYSDWYLPARDELEIAYYNLKPTTGSNTTFWGSNNYSVPKRTSNYTAGTPGQTSVSVFRSTGSEPFVAGGHWSSTEFNATNGWFLGFADGGQGNVGKTITTRVRAFRRIPL